MRSLIIGNLLYLFDWTKKTHPFVNLLLSYQLYRKNKIQNEENIKNITSKSGFEPPTISKSQFLSSPWLCDQRFPGSSSCIKNQRCKSNITYSYVIKCVLIIFTNKRMKPKHSIKTFDKNIQVGNNRVKLSLKHAN